jgi:hypothetical protein
MKSRNPNRERTLQEGAKIDKSIRKRLEKHVRGDDRKMQLAGTNHYLKRKELSCEQPRLSAHSSSKDHQKSALHYITLLQWSAQLSSQIYIYIRHWRCK